MTYLDVAEEDPHCSVGAKSVARSKSTGRTHYDLMLRFVDRHWVFLVAYGVRYLYIMHIIAFK